ncbi:hypothetical protein [Kitasatospora sp. DSM 101779]|uniref:hypothetical protein n=1 Tax=Kitasatospora sp. DSM 101779 TaxID=2853165 RepID=UPI0021DAFED7|nr:hypothetical protein [Kitasatospora sp. DSM 101779]MCU7824104.1 hypothetical protein [Kitasatospora sp. DSM 101779]
MRAKRIRAFGLSTAVAAAAVTAAAVPAHAAGTKLTFDVADSVQISAKPAAPGQFDENLHLRIGRTGTVAAKDVKVAFDTAGLAGVAQLSVPDCTTAGTVVTCDAHTIDYDSINITQHPWLSAVAGAKPGSSGKLHITLTASNAERAEKDIRVDVGGPDFKTKDLAPQKGVKPGAVVAPAVEFANVGDVAATRLVVAIDAVSGLDFKKRPSNCEFATAGEGAWNQKSWPGETMAICTLDVSLAPGTVHTLDPVQLGVAGSAWYTFTDISLYATEDAQYSSIPLWRANHRFQRGTGAPLAVRAAEDPALLAAPRHSYDNRVELEVQAANTADFSALGAWSPADGGKRGTLTVGYRNAGPASIFYRSGDDVVKVQAQFPKGVTVTKVPTGCAPKTWENGHQVEHPDKYLCDTGMWISSGTQRSFEFGISLDAGTTRPTVPVTLQDETSLYGGGATAGNLTFDPNHANEAVSVVLGSEPSGSVPTGAPTPTSGSTASTPPVVVRPTGSASASARPTTASPSASPSTGGGALAFTGASGLGTIAAAGAGAVLIGSAVFLGARRRKGAHQ